MSFELKVNGESVWKGDRHVLSVSLQSARGELAKVGTSLEDAILNIQLEEVYDGGPMRLDHLEELQRQEMKKIRTGGQAGPTPVQRDESLHGNQGKQMDTAVPVTGGDASLNEDTGLGGTREDENNEFSLNQ